jgi:hypothetical protein
MAGTVADTALQIIAATASDAGIQLAINWLNQRYAEFCARARTNQNRRWGTVYVPSPITAVTVTATTGSNQVTFSAQPVDVVTGANINPVGWHLRINVQWYFIIAGSGAGPYTLESDYSETAGTGLSCTLVERFIPVADPLCRWVSQVGHMRRRRKLNWKPYDQIQSQYTGRSLVTSSPWCWSEAPRFIGETDISPILGTSGQKFFEVYPPSSQQETYTYIYWTIPSTLSPTATLPPEIDEYVLREGVLVDVYRYKAEQWAAKPNGDQMATYYANREARQMTIWEKKIQEAQVTDALFHNQVALDIDMFEERGGSQGDIETITQETILGWTN